ncbi:MAG: winged helix DNA-binding domain-containing protein [Nitrososphaerales archaeon]
MGSADEVVAWLGAVQAQDFHGAKWALALRLRNATDESIDQAFNDGIILRTHVLRPTWHFVIPEDISWLAELTSPRVKAANAYMQRELKLDNAVFSRSNRVLAKELSGRRYLTRLEIAKALEDAGIKAEGLRLVYLIMHAELDALICSGPRRGKQFTYALTNERAPHATSLDREEALGELAKRYFTGHGPATLRDFVWWSGLTMNDARAGLEQAGSALNHEEIVGKKYWSSARMKKGAEIPEQAFLLSTFDEFLVGYESYGSSRMGGPQNRKLMLYNSPVLIGGRVVGSWRRELEKDGILISMALFTALPSPEIELINVAAKHYEKFYGLPVNCSIK